MHKKFNMTMILLFAVWGLWNGANFYMEYFAKKYDK